MPEMDRTSILAVPAQMPEVSLVRTAMGLLVAEPPLNLLALLLMVAVEGLAALETVVMEEIRHLQVALSELRAQAAAAPMGGFMDHTSRQFTVVVVALAARFRLLW